MVFVVCLLSLWLDEQVFGPNDIMPKDMLAGRQQEIHAERDRKLEEARKQRQIRRQ